MRILVSGVGQGGTCLLIEVVRGLNIVEVTSKVEDRKFFRYKVLPNNYGTKLVVDQKVFSLDKLIELMNNYPDLYVLFSLRHPMDAFMSKLVRGQKPSDGGDGTLEKDVLSDVGTVDGALSAIEHFYSIYKDIKSRFPERVLVVKLENLITMPKKEVERVAKFFGIEPNQRAFEFYKYNRNEYQEKRYGNSLDKSVIGINKRWDTWHNGFFKDRKADIDFVFDRLATIIQDWGYKQ